PAPALMAKKPPRKPAPAKKPGRLLFPHPGSPPRRDREPRDEAERAQWRNELYDYNMHLMVHQAVHGNDPALRDGFIGEVCFRLGPGVAISRADREWLVWVLTQVRRASAKAPLKAVPHLATGRPIDSRRRAMQLRQLAEIMHRNPPRGQPLRIRL